MEVKGGGREKLYMSNPASKRSPNGTFCAIEYTMASEVPISSKAKLLTTRSVMDDRAGTTIIGHFGSTSHYGLLSSLTDF